MTLYAFPADRTGCGFYRVIWPLTAVKDAVPSVITYPGGDVPLQADIFYRGDSGHPVVKGVQTPEDCSAVLLQRPTSTLLVQCIPFLKRKGISVIVEIDDNLHALSKKHPSHSVLHTALAEIPDPFSPSYPSSFVSDSADNLLRACELADLVICSTPALAAFYAPEKSVVLRNRLRDDWASCLKKDFGGGRSGPSPVPPRVSAIDNPSEEVGANDGAHDIGNIGWAGVITTHPDDLQVLGRALGVSGVRDFTVLGPVPSDTEGGIDRAARLLGLLPEHIHFTGSVPFADYLPTLQRTFANGIGLAPLEHSFFNECKSWLKPLEYAACGIPVVMSDTPEYRLLNSLGVGLIAQDHKDWRTALQALTRSPYLREELIASGRIVAEAMTYRHWAEEWIEALSPWVNR